MSEKMRECKRTTQCVRIRMVMAWVMVLVTLITVLVGCGSVDEPVKVDGGITQANLADNNSLESKTTFAVGETAELKGVQVCLVGVTESTGSSYNKPEEGNVFILFEFNIANNSNEELVVSSMMNFDTYCDDYSCSLSISALLEKGNKEQLGGTVAAGKRMNGVIGYEVPADWQELEIHYTPDFLADNDIIFVATKN